MFILQGKTAARCVTVFCVICAVCGGKRDFFSLTLAFTAGNTSKHLKRRQSWGEVLS